MTDIQTIRMTINSLGEGVLHPDETRNFTKVNETRVNYLASLGNEALPYLTQYIENPKNHDGLFEALCVVDKMADNHVDGLYRIYPSLSKYNMTDCPEIQTMLSGIYRKTLVPDAFGPLCRMLNKQISQPNRALFDPSEETGGAILEYLRAYGAANGYGQVYRGPEAFPSVRTSAPVVPITPSYSFNRPYSGYYSGMSYPSYGLKI